MSDNINTAEDNTEEALYFSLRDEIISNQNQESTILAFTYAGVLAILGIAFDKGISGIVMIACVMLVPISLRVARLRDIIVYISAYMQVYLEPEMKIRWETDHRYFRENSKEYKKYLTDISRLDFLVLYFVCTFSYWSILCINDELKFSVGKVMIAIWQIFFAVFYFVQAIRFSSVDKLKEKKIKEWEKIKNNSN